MWGWNKYGQIGNGSTENVLLPVPVGIYLNSDGSPFGSPGQTARTHWSPSAIPIRAFSTDFADNIGPSSNSTRKALSDPVRSVCLGWKHSLVLTSTNRIFGWGDVHFSVLSDLATEKINFTSLGQPSGLADDPDAEIVSEVFPKPTQLFISEDLRTASSLLSPESFLSLSGCSNATLTLLSLDVEKKPSVGNSGINSGTVVKPASKTKWSTSSLTVADSTKSIVTPNSADSRTKELSFLSPELDASSAYPKHAALSSSRQSASRKFSESGRKAVFSPLFTREKPLSSRSISFHVDPMELKERFRREVKLQRLHQQKKTASASSSDTAAATSPTAAATAAAMESISKDEEDEKGLSVAPNDEIFATPLRIEVDYSPIQDRGHDTDRDSRTPGEGPVRLSLDEQSFASADLTALTAGSMTANERESQQTMEKNTFTKVPDGRTASIQLQPTTKKNAPVKSPSYPHLSSTTARGATSAAVAGPGPGPGPALAADSLLRLFSPQNLTRVKQMRSRTMDPSEDSSLNASNDLPWLKV